MPDRHFPEMMIWHRLSAPGGGRIRVHVFPALGREPDVHEAVVDHLHLVEVEIGRLFPPRESPREPTAMECSHQGSFGLLDRPLDETVRVVVNGGEDLIMVARGPDRQAERRRRPHPCYRLATVRRMSPVVALPRGGWYSRMRLKGGGGALGRMASPLVTSKWPLGARAKESGPFR